MPPNAEKAAVSPRNRASDFATPSGIRQQGPQYDERNSLLLYFNWESAVHQLRKFWFFLLFTFVN
ncbi:hypothetical protein C4K27_1825 [Pseudomonas chlororaphis subsp. chlororaphis]|nr:hypothetical protein C4K27_1825 [Pseudomonas chlororaphis subsp. chlororaphis]